MDKIGLEKLITQYFNNNLTSEEEKWMATATRQELDSYDSEAAYTRFLQKINTEKEEQPEMEKTHTPHIYKWIMGIAASLLVLFLSTYISYQQGQSKIQKEFADIVVTTPNGSCTKVNLPDGSIVMLNAGSKITYSQGYGVTNRAVKIDGEGYFEVKKDSTRPFTVTSDNVVVKVLGTKFNFRDYPKDPTALVALDEGKVNMTSIASKQQITLKPSQHVILDKSSGNMSLEETGSLTNKGKWNEGTLAFNGEPLKDIATILARTYNVTFTFANTSKRDLHFYGIFYKDNQSIKDIMDAFAITGNIKYRIKGKNIIIF